jgi:hypothetical protein
MTSVAEHGTGYSELSGDPLHPASVPAAGMIVRRSVISHH